MTYSKAPLGVEEPKRRPYGQGVNKLSEEFSNVLSSRRPPGANSSMMSGRTSACGMTAGCGSSGAAIAIKK